MSMRSMKLLSHERHLTPLLLTTVAALSLYLAWIGYQGWGWDDAHYVSAAEAWVSNPPYIAHTHWGLRLGLVLPLAASISVFGANEFALLVVPIAYYLALLLVTYLFVRLLVGQPHANLSVLIVATVPLIAAWGSTPRVAIAEGFYIAVAFWSFAYAAVNPARSRAALLAGGLAFGFAWLSRESALGFAVGLFLLAMFAVPIPRRRFLWFAAGALVVLGAEMTFYAAYTGNPFYRLYVDLNHGTITRAGGEGEAAQAVVRRAIVASDADGARQWEPAGDQSTGRQSASLSRRAKLGASYRVKVPVG